MKSASKLKKKTRNKIKKIQQHHSLHLWADITPVVSNLALISLTVLFFISPLALSHFNDIVSAFYVITFDRWQWFPAGKGDNMRNRPKLLCKCRRRENPGTTFVVVGGLIGIFTAFCSRFPTMIMASFCVGNAFRGSFLLVFLSGAWLWVWEGDSIKAAKFLSFERGSYFWW